MCPELHLDRLKLYYKVIFFSIKANLSLPHVLLSDMLLDIVAVVPEEKRISLHCFVITSFQGRQT